MLSVRRAASPQQAAAAAALLQLPVFSNGDAHGRNAYTLSAACATGRTGASTNSILGALAAAVGVVGFATGIAHARAPQPQSKSLPAPSPAKPALGAAPGAPAQPQAKDAQGHPLYTAEEVSKHKTPSDRVWVTYKDGVYDITDFVALHPGGAAKIMLAAGGRLEPFWALYQQHQKAEIAKILEEYRIGTLAGGAAAAPARAIADPYASEPARHPALLARSQRPYNGETPSTLLAANLVTPTDIFFVRNHLPVPTVNVDEYELKVEGEGLRSLHLTLEELKSRFRKHTITATVQCSGNRRNEMKALKPVKGLEWDQGAISTAVWGGVLLRDVLQAAGIREGDPSIKHILFEGLDNDATTGEVYGASIPVSKALSASADVLLAYEMNGAPLSRDHGAPLRVVVPGVTGARSVKWLGRISASATESSSHWQQKDYKSFSPEVDWDTVDWGSAPAIQESPVTSAICEPSPGTTISASDEEVTVRGYAWSGGGRAVVRVDVSPDGGATWTPAKLMTAPGQGWDEEFGKAWAWTLWEVTLPLPKPAAAAADAGASAPRSLQLVCKAVDSSYNNQPDSVAPIWNLRGVVNNAWHRVEVKVEDD